MIAAMIPLFLDCQTTGMHPRLGQLLELAWESLLGKRSYVIALAEGKTPPPRVSDITGLTEAHLAGAVPETEALAALEKDMDLLGEGAVIAAHYAQFERAFLAEAHDRLRQAPLPWKLLCTFRISKLLHPEVPSRNIRALVGFFGLGSSEIRRAGEHAAATARIWEALAPQIPGTLHEIEQWLATTKAPKDTKTSFRMDRLKRLQLPEGPGIYRMLAQDGRVLYVGKATSLRARVNSYFRGKGQGKREMIVQVWDIQVTECASAREAALLESEEIKRLDPPYNVVLKTGRRSLLFYSRDFASSNAVSDAEHPLGPFLRNNSIAAVAEWTGGGEPLAVFFDSISDELRNEGLSNFLSRHGWSGVPSLRKLVALGARLLRERNALLQELAEAQEEIAERGPEEEEERPVTAEEVADRLEGLMMRAAWEYLRSKRMTRLLNCRVKIGDRLLEVNGGKLGRGAKGLCWEGLGLAEFDRMSVLLTEVVRYGYEVERIGRQNYYQ